MLILKEKTKKTIIDNIFYKTLKNKGKSVI